MKIQRLIIHNIASIQDADIDFNKDALAHEPLFLICGETGAGKTTILDAICLALYNNTPRMNHSYKENIGEDENNKLYINDNRLLMRRGAGEASSTLYFEGNNHINYEAKWYVKRAWMKSDGKLKTVEWSLTKLDKNISLTKHAEINHELELAVGINFEQFCRTTMLAQGEFTKFLQSDAKSKSEILEKLTGTDIYSRIGMKIAEIAKAKKNDYDLQKQKTDSFEFFSEEQKASMLERQHELEEQKKALYAEIEKIQSCIHWQNTFNELTQKLKEKEDSLKEQLSKKESDTYRKKGRCIQLYDIASNILPEVRTLQDKNSQLEGFKITQEDCLKQYQQLFSELQGKVSQVQLMRNKNEEVEAMLNKNEVYQPMYEQMQTILTQLQELGKGQSQITIWKSELHKEIQKRDNSKEQITSKENFSKKCIEELQTIVEQAKQIELKINELKATQPSKQQENVFQRMEQLKDIQHTISAYLEQLQEEKNKKERFEKCKQEIEQQKKEYHELSGKVEAAKVQWENTEKLYNKQKMSLEDWAKEARAKLAPGDVCPVCNRVIEDTFDEEKLLSSLSPLYKQLEEDKKTYRELEGIFNSATAQLKTTSEKVNSLQDELQKAINKSNILKEKVSTLTTEISLDNNGLAHIDTQLKVLEEQRKSLKAQIDSIDLEEKKYTKLKTQENKKREEKEFIEKSLKELQNLLAKQEGVIKTTQEHIAESESNVAQRMNTLQEIILLPSWKEEWEKNPSELTKNLQQQALQWQKWNKEKDSLQQKIKEQEEEINRITTTQEKLLKENPDFMTLSIKSIIPQDKLEDRCSQLLQKVISIQTQIDTAKKDISQKNTLIQQFLSEHQEYSMETLNQLANIKLEIIQSIREELKRVDENILKAKTELKAIEDSKKEHENQRCDYMLDKSIEAWKNEMTSLKERDANYTEVISEIKMKIKNDEEQKEKLQKELEILQELEKVYLDWDELRSYFGDDKGTRFRGIAQSFVLKELLNGANYYLKYFTERYELTGQPGSLTILLKDYYQGGLTRPITTLSGGESFLVSLSLALGLSALNKNGQEIDTLFIDEGFGTLSSDYLNTVMDTLEKLHQIGGKRVGIISHVEELKERIKTQIQVSKKQQSLSVVKIVRL